MGIKAPQYSAEWPYNLLNELKLDTMDPLDLLDDQGSVEIAMSIARLTNREKQIIRKRYVHEMPLKDVGSEYSVTPERIRQIEETALKKITQCDDAQFILLHGAKDYIDKRIEDEVNERYQTLKDELERLYEAKTAMASKEYLPPDQAAAESQARALATPIERLDLSARAYNALKQAYCDTVCDIVTRFPDYEQASMIRNLGKKSMDEIRYALKCLGITWPVENEE